MLEENNVLMEELDGLIEKQREEVEERRTEASHADARLTIEKAKVIYKIKTMEGVGDTVAKSKAEIDTESLLIAYKAADAAYRGSRIKLETLVDRKDTLREKNFNERAAMKVFNG